MRPADFPERRNARRKRALARLSTRLPSQDRDAEELTLRARIVTTALFVISRKYGGPGLIGRPQRDPKVERA